MDQPRRAGSVAPAPSEGDRALRLAQTREPMRHGREESPECCVALDARGFIKTGPDLTKEDLTAARWSLARLPHLLETTLPGVFAVGDVRAGNMKRVASAVGEGSTAIAFVHRILGE